MKLAPLFLLVATLGCSPTTYQHGVPNLALVDATLWRSGQPTTAEGWAYLRSLGIRHVIKLDDESEGSDALAVAAGMTVHVLTIEPIGDRDVWDDIFGVFKSPDSQKVLEAETIIANEGGLLVHCKNGWDRTGLIIGIHRVLHWGWSKEAAYREMLRRGFHPELYGLQHYWDVKVP
jgi:protein tyrosine/serine phosphatase